MEVVLTYITGLLMVIQNQKFPAPPPQFSMSVSTKSQTNTRYICVSVIYFCLEKYYNIFLNLSDLTIYWLSVDFTFTFCNI